MNKKDIAIIDLIIKTSKGLTLTQLMGSTKLPKATLYHRLDRLVANQILHKNNKHYLLGSVLLQWMNERQDKPDFLHLLHPYLEDISRTSKQTVHLVQLRGNNAVYIDKIEYDRSNIQIKSYIGKEMSLYSTGSGRAILSSFTDSALDHYLSTQKISAKTSSTKTDLGELKSCILESRRIGYAIEVGEDVAEIQCAGISFNLGSEVLAISISTTRLIDLTELNEMGEYLLTMKQKIIAELNI